MKKVLFFLSLFFLLFLSSCTPEDNIFYSNNAPACLDGSCDAVFRIDTQVNPGSYQDANGVWHVKYAGYNYFTVAGNLDQLNPEYVINGVPLIETAYDSNYFYIAGNVSWTYPIYSYLGMFSNSNFSTPIPVGSQTYTFSQLNSQTSIMNLARYTIHRNPYPDINHPAYPTYFSSYSKYNYNPRQSMVFFPEMIGQKVTVYIKVTFNNDFYGNREEKFYTLNLIFEN